MYQINTKTMRKIIIQEFISLDGVIQAPGGEEEDKSHRFEYCGWTAPFFYRADEEANEFMSKNMNSTDLLLGRLTYEIFAAYWPKHADMWPGINDVTKYVVSDGPVNLSWENSKQIKGNVAQFVKELKAGSGSLLKVIGSGQLARTLFRHDLVDELWLITFPVILGPGKRLFG